MACSSWRSGELAIWRTGELAKLQCTVPVMVGPSWSKALRDGKPVDVIGPDGRAAAKDSPMSGRFWWHDSVWQRGPQRILPQLLRLLSTVLLYLGALACGRGPDVGEGLGGRLGKLRLA